MSYPFEKKITLFNSYKSNGKYFQYKK